MIYHMHIRTRIVGVLNFLKIYSILGERHIRRDEQDLQDGASHLHSVNPVHPVQFIQAM